MENFRTHRTAEQAADQVLGYLNFSSGTPDPAFLTSLNELFEHIAGDTGDGTYHAVFDLLRRRLRDAAASRSAFRDSSQAERVLTLVHDTILPAYLDYHRDLLAHQTPDIVFNSFFIGRACEVALRLVSAETNHEPLAQRAMRELNDYLGYRPVAALESQKIEPYEHEYVSPIPLYIRQVGVAHGRYQALVQQALEILRKADASVLDAAQFDVELLDELAVDPRAFDFDHPVNKRPNHHFGQWDQQRIDQHGNYRRFIVQQITLDALTARIEEEPELPRDELLREAGAVLAGTILMAAGISGRGPAAHDSTMTLGTLLPKIANYRDAFYDRLLHSINGAHRERLLGEAAVRKQPFGAARQHLNRQLAAQRAFQLTHVTLARLFAWMGYPEAAERQTQLVPVASARLMTEIDNRLVRLELALDHGRWHDLVPEIPEIVGALQRAIGCGAVVDPWNILGFDANYSLFPASENSVHDHRADDLITVVERLLEICSQLWIEAAAEDRTDLAAAVEAHFRQAADWWRQYAAHEVSAVDAADPWEVFEATKRVAQALNLWHKKGAEANQISFWAKYADLFQWPQAYGLAIEALLRRDDYGTSMALLVHWLSQADKVGLQRADSSFFQLMTAWLDRQRAIAMADIADAAVIDTVWGRIRKFYDYLEANAEDYWSVPDFHLGSPAGVHRPPEPAAEPLEDPDDAQHLYEAAYEGVVYRDTTDDGIDGSLEQPDQASDESLADEAQRLAERLEFIESVADFWRTAVAISSAHVVALSESGAPLATEAVARLADQRQSFKTWLEQATIYRAQLGRLLDSLSTYVPPEASDDPQWLLEYERHRSFKESMLERTMQVTVDIENASRLLGAAIFVGRYVEGEPVFDQEEHDETAIITTVFAALMLGHTEAVRRWFDILVDAFQGLGLLYVPLAKGGAAESIVSIRARQCAIGEMLDSLPRLGLFTQARELAHVVLLMERNQSSRNGAVTEFDELFRTAYEAMVQTLVASCTEFEAQRRAEGVEARVASREASDTLFDSLEMLTESMLLIWLAHSRTLRLSVLEKIADVTTWRRLVSFIETYGDDLFDQQLLSRPQLAAILHMGVDRWFKQLEQHPDPPPWKILADLDQHYPRKLAARQASIVYEAIYESYNEFRDYNSTTTQSDRGSMIHILLDFLSLRNKYDRICWHLRPVIWGHEVLVRCQQNRVAKQWRRSLTERVDAEAEKFVEKFQRLQEKYSIQMASIGERLSERFVHPTHIDQMLSLIEPAMRDPLDSRSQRSFEMLEQQIGIMARRPLGVGVELPKWLSALEEEVQHQGQSRYGLPAAAESESLAPRRVIPLGQLREEIEGLPRQA
jgi:hypothetical protein